MELLHTSVVEADEIDALGHLNVRYYATRAKAANTVLLGRLGLGAAAVERLGGRLVGTDTYTRYHREQFRGATLAVRGGVLATHDGAVQAYFEVDNDAKGEVAATFILTTTLIQPETRAAFPLPGETLAAAADLTTGIPDHGRPRSLSLDLPRLDVTWDDLASRLEENPADPMGTRSERVIEAADCDIYGYLNDTEEFMFGHVRPMPLEPGKREQRWGPMTFRTAEGHHVGWASLETRQLRLAQPRAGDLLRSIGAELGVHEKIRHSRRWIFNITRGEVVAMNDNIALALDLDARRPIAIPPKLRADLEKRRLPEFA